MQAARQLALSGLFQNAVHFREPECGHPLRRHCYAGSEESEIRVVANFEQRCVMPLAMTVIAKGFGALGLAVLMEHHTT